MLVVVLVSAYKSLQGWAKAPKKSAHAQNQIERRIQKCTRMAEGLVLEAEESAPKVRRQGPRQS